MDLILWLVLPTVSAGVKDMGHKRGVYEYLTTKIWDIRRVNIKYTTTLLQRSAKTTHMRHIQTTTKKNNTLQNTYFTNQLLCKKTQQKPLAWVVIKINNPNRLLFQTYLNHGPSLNRLCSPRNFCKISRPKAHGTTSRAQLHTLNVKSSWLCQGSSCWLARWNLRRLLDSTFGREGL